MDIQDLKKYCKEVIFKHPELEEQIVDLYFLCVSEIEEGGSSTHEINLCMSDIEDLVTDLQSS